jgi:hypothetical protein
MPLGIFLFAVGTFADSQPLTALENLIWVISCLIVVAGLALAWWAGGALFSQNWRASPRGRLGLLHPLFPLLLIPLVAAGLWFGPAFLAALFAAPSFLALIAHPLLTALLLRWVIRQVCALGETAPFQSKLGFGLVAGMGLVLLGGLLWNLVFMLIGGNTWWNFLPAIPFAIFVAYDTLLGHLRSHGNFQADPKDASSSDLDSSQGPRGYRG